MSTPYLRQSVHWSWACRFRRNNPDLRFWGEERIAIKDNHALHID